MKNMLYVFLILVMPLLLSCRTDSNKDIKKLMDYWLGRKIVFPEIMHFYQYGDTVDYKIRNDVFKIVSYVDSNSCQSCKLQLLKWKQILLELENKNVELQLILITPYSSNMDELQHIILRDSFNYPICIDKMDSCNIINKFPTETSFQTFLLNPNNEVIAVGNPAHNPKIKKIFFKVVMNEGLQDFSEERSHTDVKSNSTVLDLGSFNWQLEQVGNFTLNNVGQELLVIDDVATSCGCTTVDYIKKPVKVGDSIVLKVKYKAEHPEHFNKTITIYCNAENAPLKLRITGNAE